MSAPDQSVQEWCLTYVQRYRASLDRSRICYGVKCRADMGRDKVRAFCAFGSALAYSVNRSAPIMDITFSTSAESVTGIRFNPSESSVLASIGSDRTFTLYDIRTGKAERRVVMSVRILFQDGPTDP